MTFYDKFCVNGFANIISRMRKLIAKTSSGVPDKVVGCISRLWKAYDETTYVELPKRKLVMPSIKKFTRYLSL